MAQGCIIWHSQYFIITVSGIRSVKILKLYVVQLKLIS